MIEWKRGVAIGTLALLGGLTAGVSKPIIAQSGESCGEAYAARIATIRDRCGDIAPGVVCLDGQGAVAVGKDGRSLPPGVWPLESVQAISTMQEDETDQLPGIAVMRVPAFEPDTFLTTILYGEAQLTNVPGEPQAPACTARSIGTVNVRRQPNTSSAIMGQLTMGQQVPVSGRLADATWWQIVWEGEPAWIFAELAPAECDPAAMLVVDPISGEVTGGIPAPGFQGAQFESSFSTPRCGALPRAGLLLQSDGGAATWRLNGEQLSIDGTVLVQASDNDILAIQVLEGQVKVVLDGVTRAAQTGQLLRVPQSGGAAAGVPGPASDYVAGDAAVSPLALLPRQILPPPATVTSPVDGVGIACDWLPQTVTVTAEAGEATLVIPGASGRALRLSAEGSGLTALGYEAPDGHSEQLQGNGPFVIEFHDSEVLPGNYRIIAQTAIDEAILFGVTCDLPTAVPPQETLDCRDFLLRWEAVSGSKVQFQAPGGTRFSVIAEHALPSNGAAGVLSILTADGEQTGATDFFSVGARQVAGPLTAEAPADGTYVVTWDGDPFNLVNVEVVCVLPQSEAGE